MVPTRFALSTFCLNLAILTVVIVPSRAAADDDGAAVPHGAKVDGSGARHGNASFYSQHLSGRKTASGERYDPTALTAAHRTLPLGTQVRIVNPKNDRSVVVTVNDRGPLSRKRAIDVSGAAADQLDMRRSGVTKVEMRIVGEDTAPSPGTGGAAQR